MTDIPIKANVVCNDGPCGQSTNVIFNPVNHKVTHFALRDKSLADNPTRLVPAGMVADVTPQQITLTCSKADVADMPPFIVTNFIPQSAPGYAYATGEVYQSQYVVNDTAYDSVNEMAIPAGEEEVHSGMHVQATDGKVGKLDALVLDPESGAVTHILLREGHLWGKKDVAIPVADIKYSDGESVYVTLDKETIKALPAVPVKEP
jgi:sporulation protein YlmC with PRC-barrel domain